MKSSTLRVNQVAGDRITGLLAESLGIAADGSIPTALFDVCNQFAHGSESAEEFSHWYLRAQCFSKFNPGDAATRVRLEQAALGKFRTAEDVCSASNSRLVDPWTRCSLDQSVWRRARGIIASILGPFKLGELPWQCGFGPGASSGLTRQRASHQKKWVLSSHITEGARSYHWAFARWSTLDVRRHVEVVQGNRITTVPKDWKTDRCIAIEPDWNMFYQKGVGAMLRRRLNRWGILLPEAQSINQALARLGSWTGSLATLDMSMASDSISLALCEALLPEDWLRVLYDLRSPMGVMPNGETIAYAKISSMGNGFTFELETLLFYALTLAVCGKGNRDRVSVYGDDVVCPSEDAEAVLAVLAQAGFTPNASKSFHTGPFRESCGGHYWRGRDVTPFYLRHHPSTTGDLIVLGNHLVAHAAKRQWGDLGPFTNVHSQVRRLIPRALRGPYGMDGVLWANWDECCPTWRRSYQSYRQKAVKRIQAYTDVSQSMGSYLHKLWVNSPEVRAGQESRSTTRETLTTVYCDRDMWTLLPVRTAMP